MEKSTTVKQKCICSFSSIVWCYVDRDKTHTLKKWFILWEIRLLKNEIIIIPERGSQIARKTEFSYLLKVLLLLLSHFSRVRLCATPQMAAHQAPPSLGFSRQEHWSGLPFPFPMHEVKSESEVAQLCLTLRNPMDCSPPGSSIHGIFQARVLEWGVISFSYNITYLESKFYFTHFNYCYDYLSRLKELEK